MIVYKAVLLLRIDPGCNIELLSHKEYLPSRCDWAQVLFYRFRARVYKAVPLLHIDPDYNIELPACYATLPVAGDQSQAALQI